MDKAEISKSLLDHIHLVDSLLRSVVRELVIRGRDHDLSKFEPEEFPLFSQYTPKLKGCTYGSLEYKQYLKELQPALESHYKLNRHHPEHFPEGIKGMNLIDLVEMIADWLAATKRHSDGDIFRSIELNQKRFGYSDELKSIFRNTVEFLTSIEGEQNGKEES